MYSSKKVVQTLLIYLLADGLDPLASRGLYIQREVDLGQKSCLNQSRDLC